MRFFLGASFVLSVVDEIFKWYIFMLNDFLKKMSWKYLHSKYLQDKITGSVFYIKALNEKFQRTF